MITVPAAVMLLALYLIIFGFSAQDGETSGGLSYLISEKCAAFLNALSGERWSEAIVAEFAAYFEHPLRKLAHFAEYAVMGILLTVIWVQWMRPGKRLCLLIVLWVFISAAADELHQYFVPGRYASVADVLLDTCGGAFGMMVCLHLRRRIKGNIENSVTCDTSLPENR